ncbi:hypothetical protein KA005_14485, partial [bacterium]|nr:hypothetical protein [bacterium]
MHRIWIGLLFLIIFGLGCGPPPLSHTATLDWQPVTLPATWTLLPTSSGTPAEISPAMITATTPPGAGTPFPEFQVPFYNMQMVSPRDGWAWGWTNELSTQIWRTSDGGQTWMNVSPPPEVQDFEYALDSEIAWATVCWPTGANCEQALAITLNGGETWTAILYKDWRSVSKYRFYNNEVGILSGYDVGAGSGYWRFYETDDGGTTWTPVEFVSGHQDGGSLDDWPGQYQTCNICGDALYFDLDLLIIVEGNLAQIPAGIIPLWITEDLGKSWMEIELPLPPGPFNPGWFYPHQLDFFNDQDGILPVKLATEDQDRSAMVFYFTKNGGVSWAVRSVVEDIGLWDRWTQIEFVSVKDIFFPCGNDLCASNDGAQTWQRLSTNLNFNYIEGETYVRQFQFVDSSTGWALVGLDRYDISLWQ